MLKFPTIATAIFFIGVPIQTKHNINYNIYSAKEQFCLAETIYHESKGESQIGKLATGLVVLQRDKSRKFPNDVCKVTKQKHQFSWFWDGKPDIIKKKSKAWKESLQVAKHLSDNFNKPSFINFLKEATHFHATYVKPTWTKKFIKIARIDKHIFYKEKES